MGVEGIRAVSDYKAYTADEVLDLLHFVARKMMKPGDAHFSRGITDNLDDPKYKHYKYWSNPLETRLPHAPDMEIYSMYGVGIPTANGDETIPVLSPGFMCAKGWWGKTRFNPSGIRTFIREYEHTAPANLLKGRGTHSSAHVDILGNFTLIEDIIRVAAGASGDDLGGHRVHSEIFKGSENINSHCNECFAWQLFLC
ncbi:Phospholipid:diacylglycerol acyltransferase [Arachis hypogaea]|nr:Phospholipid:diacylglycerol acyltransferase [Arachis hypogaea]